MKAQTVKMGNVQQDVKQPTESKLSVVKFHQSKISCSIDQTGQVWVGINPICEAIGLDVKRALLTIKQDTILGAKVSEQTLLDAKNRKFPMQCIPIEYVHGWLFLIQENKVSAAAKPKLVQFKKECYQVLFDHFYGKYKIYENNLRKRQLLIAELGKVAAEKNLLSARISQIKKDLGKIEEEELTGQLSMFHN
jgi:hypothetical protein